MGAGGGKTSSGSSTGSMSYLAPYFAKIAGQAWKTIAPTFQTLAGQTNQALSTGGVNANIPAINSKLASARMAASTSDQSLKDDLSKSGLINSSFGEQLLSEQRSAEGQSVASIPSDYTSAFLGMGIPAAFGEGSSAMGIGTSGTTGLQSTTTTSTPSFMDYFLQASQIGSQYATAAALA